MQKLTIIIPIYNERELAEPVLRFLHKAACPIAREWIVVDDGSTDGTLALLHQLKSELNFKLISHPQNRGKGAAIRAGIQEATGTLILIQDADFEYNPDDIPSLLAPLLNDSVDVVFGSRFQVNSDSPKKNLHYLANRTLTMLSNVMSGIKLTDMETCYKVFRADLLKPMNLVSERFGIEVELTAYLAKTSARLRELPIRYQPRTQLQGKKITWVDGIAALFHLVWFNYFVSKKQAFRAHHDPKTSTIRRAS